jgi:FkbM family methyltransferase
MRSFDSTYKVDSPTAQILLTEIASIKRKLAPRTVDKPLILFGAGNLGKMAYDYFKHLGIKVSAVLDNHSNQAQEDPFWQGLIILKPEACPTNDLKKSLVAVCVANAPFTEISNQIQGMGGTDIVPFYDICEAYRSRHPLGNGWFAKEFSSEMLDAMQGIIEMWYDDTSRAYYLQMLAWRRIREEWSFANAPITTHDRFFITEVKKALNNSEVFVDIGAHSGSVLKQFIRATGSSFQEIHLYEPDPKNLLDLQHTLQALPTEVRRRISVNSKAVGCKNEIASFYSNIGYASQISELGKHQVEVIKLDNQNLSPSIMKLHIEGHELLALQGAIRTVKENRPILLITIYHNSDALYKIPQWLRLNLSNYKIILRLHSWHGTGAVIYGLPLCRPSNKTRKIKKWA